MVRKEEEVSVGPKLATSSQVLGRLDLKGGILPTRKAEVKAGLTSKRLEKGRGRKVNS